MKRHTNNYKVEMSFCAEFLRRFKVKVDPHEIRSKSRRSELVFVRSLIALILRKKGYSYSYTGSIINRDHATVINLLKYSDKQQCRNPSYNKIARAITNDVVKGNGSPEYKFKDFAEWKQSTGGKICINFNDLKSQTYLENRLYRAFVQAREKTL